jgi:hypothetical protein
MNIISKNIATGKESAGFEKNEKNPIAIIGKKKSFNTKKEKNFSIKRQGSSFVC